MNTNDILKKVDHTLLAQSATWEDIKVILDDGTDSRCHDNRYSWQHLRNRDTSFTRTKRIRSTQ